MAVIELTNLTKTYGGNSRGVSDISLAIEEGSVFGFLGPNGAGKTTTISMLVDLIRPTNGSVKIFGLESQKDGVEIRKRIGFLAGDFALDESLTGRQQLEYFGSLRGGVDSKRIIELAKRFDCNLNRPIQNLSRGNRQKVGLISALMHDPELLIFDEPTSGLDPLMQAEFNEVIREHQKAGKTAFISSHLLSEVQEICSEVAFIREGKIIAIRKMYELQHGSPKRLSIVSGDSSLSAKLKKLAGIQELTHHGEKIEATFSGDPNALIKLIGSARVKDLIVQEADLETIFMQYYQEKNSA